MIDLAVLSAPEPSQPPAPSDEEDDCEGSDAESTARSISRDDLLGLPKWTAEDSGGETIRASREANYSPVWNPHVRSAIWSSATAWASVTPEASMSSASVTSETALACV